MSDIKVTEMIELLNKEENKYGAVSGRERELNLSINGQFVGGIKNAKLDGWGDGLVTDVTLELQVNMAKYYDKKIRNQAIDGFVEKFIFKAVCEGCSGCCSCYKEGRQFGCEDYKVYMGIAEQIKAIVAD